MARGKAATVSIDMGKKCSDCGETGATECGLCLKCVAKNTSKDPHEPGVKNGLVAAFFKEAKLMRDGEGHAILRLDFSIVMTDAKAELAPKAIAAEWKYMKAERLNTEQVLNGERIPVQVVEARMWPDKPQSPAFRAVGRVERVKLTEVEDKNSTYIELKLSIRRGKDVDSWHWLEVNWPGSMVWLKFEEAQGEILAQFEAEDSEGSK